MHVVRKKWRINARIATRAQHPRRSYDVKAVEIEATIDDKVVLNVLVDRGSGLNIFPTQTMDKLGLSLASPSPFVINMAN